MKWIRNITIALALGAALVVSVPALAATHPRPQTICADPTGGGRWNLCAVYNPATNALYGDFTGPGTRFRQVRNHGLHAWALVDSRTGNCVAYGQFPIWATADQGLGYFYETRCTNVRNQAFRWLPAYGGGLDIWVLAGRRYLSMDVYGLNGNTTGGRLLVGLPARLSGYPTALWKFFG